MMNRLRRLRFWMALSVVILMLIAASPRFAESAPPTSAPSNSADLYLQAAAAIRVESPAASNLEYRGFPPFGPDWDRLAADASNSNGEARRLAREARSAEHATWPADLQPPTPAYLNSCRALANELG